MRVKKEKEEKRAAEVEMQRAAGDKKPEENEKLETERESED